MRRTPAVALFALLSYAAAAIAMEVAPPPASAPAPRAGSPLMAPPAGLLPVVIYTKENAPKERKLEDLPLKESVSQYGITWTFEKPARVGQFVNGDWYVVGAVTVKAIDPAPRWGTDVEANEVGDREARKVKPEQRLRNGSMLNPPVAMRVACDSGIYNFYDFSLNTPLPAAMKPGDSLVSTISLKLKEKSEFIYHSGGRREAGDNSPLKVGAVLTCVAEPLPADAFRPGFTDRAARVYLARDLKRSQLPILKRARDCFDPQAYALVFQKPWLNTCFFGFEEPMENMPHYGQWVGQAAGEGVLLLCMDFKPEEKERLLLNYVQVGIDYWSMVKQGHPGWSSWGGHGSGRKLPIVFAGWMLGDEQMANVSKNCPKCEFGEDNQTAYGECWTGAKVVFGGHSGISTSTGEGRDDVREHAKWGPYEHLNPEQWGKDNFTSEAYRRCCSSNCFAGQALALRVLKLEGLWNHDAFFDYVDRWMYEDDKPARAVINQWYQEHFKRLMTSEEPGKEWAHEGYTGDAWVKDFWNQHRLGPGMPPADGWKKPHSSKLPPCTQPMKAEKWKDAEIPGHGDAERE